MTIELTAPSEPASSYESVVLPIHQRLNRLWGALLEAFPEFWEPVSTHGGWSGSSDYDLTLRAALRTLQARGLDVKRLRVVGK